MAPSSSNPIVFLDIKIGAFKAGRIEIELFADTVPRTAANFLHLCMGDKGIGKTTGKELSYQGTKFHRIIRGFMCQGGDFSAGNGTGGESIYGGKFADENFALRHTKAGALSMANSGKDTNGSQFFLTLKPTPHLDGKHVVFGLVVSGMEVVRAMEAVETGQRDKPIDDVTILRCGVVEEGGASPPSARHGGGGKEEKKEKKGKKDKKAKKEQKEAEKAAKKLAKKEAKAKQKEIERRPNDWVDPSQLEVASGERKSTDGRDVRGRGSINPGTRAAPFTMR